MPATTPNINLLFEDDGTHTPQGRIAGWALTYGRYIMIGTEIVVLLAFISRFSLDRKLTDLKEDIDQKQAILKANLPLETEIRKTQDTLVQVKTLMTGQGDPLDTMSLVNLLLPQDVFFTTLDIDKDRISAETVAGTTEGFSQFLNNLQSVKKIQQVDIGEVHKDPVNGIGFRFTALLTAPKK